MNTITKATLAEQIYEIIKRDILEVNYLPNEKITLKLLQERFETSSTPVREALKRLVADGLVDHVTNIGAKVIEISNKDAKEIFELCEILDSGALKYAWENNYSTLLTELERNIENQKLAIDLNNIPLFNLYSDQFHDIFYNVYGNKSLLDSSKRIRDKITILTNINLGFSYSYKDILFDHESIYLAIKEMDLKKALTLLNKHLTSDKRIKENK
jgi:DNA-binding GntR family transcriptional regulator